MWPTQKTKTCKKPIAKKMLVGQPKRTKGKCATTAQPTWVHGTKCIAFSIWKKRTNNLLICNVQQSFECYKIGTLTPLLDVYNDWAQRMTGLHGVVANVSCSASLLLKTLHLPRRPISSLDIKTLLSPTTVCSKPHLCPNHGTPVPLFAQ